MLMANGHSPTPKISPFCVFVRLNSTPQSSMICVRTTNPNAVATIAMKQPQNSSFSFGPTSSLTAEGAAYASIAGDPLVTWRCEERAWFGKRIHGLLARRDVHSSSGRRTSSGA